MRKPTMVAWAALALAGVAVAAEIGTTQAAGPSSADVEREVRKGYEAYWDALITASATGDEKHPALAAHAAGNLLPLLRTNIVRLRDEGFVAKGTVEHKIRGVKVAPDGQLAYLFDCVSVKNWSQYDRKTGRQRPDQFLDRPDQMARFTLAPSNGVWVVTDAQTGDAC